jgi:hypothetical protein
LFVSYFEITPGKKIQELFVSPDFFHVVKA